MRSLDLWFLLQVCKAPSCAFMHLDNNTKLTVRQDVGRGELHLLKIYYTWQSFCHYSHLTIKQFKETSVKICQCKKKKLWQIFWLVVKDEKVVHATVEREYSHQKGNNLIKHKYHEVWECSLEKQAISWLLKFFSAENLVKLEAPSWKTQQEDYLRLYTGEQNSDLGMCVDLTVKRCYL